jgi:hypothetical protein
MPSESPFLGAAKLRVTDAAFLQLFAKALSKIPADVPPLRSVTSVGLKRKGNIRGVVGLTRWCGVRYGKTGAGETQTITFYTDLFLQLSDDAKMAVIAHELAHSWLNEHVSPGQSLKREREADALARRWGFGHELNELDNETETIYGP